MHIPGSCIEKCVHGVYLASPDEVKTSIATYCGWCTPEGAYPSPAWKESIQNNPCLKRAFNSSSCPQCGSETHYVEGRYWVCSECKNEWRPPKRLRGAALMSIRTLA